MPGCAKSIATLLDERNDVDIPLSIHVYPFPDIEEWEGQWFFFDVQLHPYELHFRRKVIDGDGTAVGSWEDLYGKLAQVRGQMCLQQYVWSLPMSFLEWSRRFRHC